MFRSWNIEFEVLVLSALGSSQQSFLFLADWAVKLIPPSVKPRFQFIFWMNEYLFNLPDAIASPWRLFRSDPQDLRRIDLNRWFPCVPLLSARWPLEGSGAGGDKGQLTANAIWKTVCMWATSADHAVTVLPPDRRWLWPSGTLANEMSNSETLTS